MILEENNNDLSELNYWRWSFKAIEKEHEFWSSNWQTENGVKLHKKTLCKRKPEAPKKGAKLPRKPSKQGKLKCWSPEHRAELKENPPWEETPIVEHYRMKLSTVQDFI